MQTHAGTQPGREFCCVPHNPSSFPCALGALCCCRVPPGRPAPPRGVKSSGFVFLLQPEREALCVPILPHSQPACNFSSLAAVGQSRCCCCRASVSTLTPASAPRSSACSLLAGTSCVRDVLEPHTPPQSICKSGRWNGNDSAGASDTPLNSLLATISLDKVLI